MGKDLGAETKKRGFIDWVEVSTPTVLVGALAWGMFTAAVGVAPIRHAHRIEPAVGRSILVAVLFGAAGVVLAGGALAAGKEIRRLYDEIDRARQKRVGWATAAIGVAMLLAGCGVTVSIGLDGDAVVLMLVSGIPMGMFVLVATWHLILSGVLADTMCLRFDAVGPAGRRTLAVDALDGDSPLPKVEASQRALVAMIGAAVSLFVVFALVMYDRTAATLPGLGLRIRVPLTDWDATVAVNDLPILSGVVGAIFAVLLGALVIPSMTFVGSWSAKVTENLPLPIATRESKLEDRIAREEMATKLGLTSSPLASIEKVVVLLSPLLAGILAPFVGLG